MWTGRPSTGAQSSARAAGPRDRLLRSAADDSLAGQGSRGRPVTSTRSVLTPYGEQDENGTDLSPIRALLRISPAERLRRGDDATTDALRLRSHARRA